MIVSKYVSELWRLICEQQSVQMCVPPSSVAWQNASAELARLGELLNATRESIDSHPREESELERARRRAIID